MNKPCLIHACCGICFAYPMILLRELGFEPIVYYFNPNIYPENEFGRRYLELEKYCGLNKVKLIRAKYCHNDFLEFIKGHENDPERGERCKKCFEYRLFCSAEFAKRQKIGLLATTLTVSPHKISKDIFSAGKRAAQKFGLEFLELDFKKKEGFKKTSKIAYDFGMYRQNYCGCEFSLR